MKIFLLLSFSLGVLAKVPDTLFVRGEKLTKLLIEPHLGKDVEVKGVVQKEVYKNKMTLKVENSAQIKTPAKNIYVILESADQIHIQNFKNRKINVSIRSGEIFLKESQGDFSISVDKGKIRMNNNSGKLRIQSYKADIQINQFQGDMHVFSYQNPIHISQSKGLLHLSTFSGNMELRKVEGDLDYSTHRSDIRLRSFLGNIKGLSRSGSIHGSLTPHKVKIESQSGDINLYFLDSKARVEAQSWEGKVYAPKNFYKDRAGGVYQASGFIQGRGTQKGGVSLKSRSGNIRIN